MPNYNTEYDGRIAFYKKLGYQGNQHEENCNVDYSQNTDGVINGVLFEHKPVINNNTSPINKVLGQAIKYLSRKRINAVDVPDTIILVSQNDEIAYHFRSENYFSEIHQFYTTSASNDNDLSLDTGSFETIHFNNKTGIERIKDLISESNYIKVNVDVYSIISLARRYYKNNYSSQKNDFLNEIRNPQFFQFINPYTKAIDDNSEFGYIMDKLNDEMLQQEIGAYYTPIQYSEKSLELVREAIANRPEGNNYVIIDRCAGTGNLEEKMTDEEISNCILNTYEYFEWLELRRQYTDRALYVVPQTDKTYVKGEGVIKDGDALAEEFYKNEFIQNILNNKKITVIIFENPPYFSGNRNVSALVVNSASGESGKKRSLKAREHSWVYKRMQEVGYPTVTIENTVREFIWSAYADYLRQNGDCLIVYSPVAYFNWYRLQDKMLKLKFDKGFGFNRRYFNASDALISCIKWIYEDKYDAVSQEQKEFPLELFNINKQGQLEHIVEFNELTVKKVFTSPTYYFKNKNQNGAFACLSNNGSAPKTGLGCLYSIVCKTERNDETYLNAGNFYNLLPIYIAQLTFDRTKWYNNDNTLRSADRKDDYLQSQELLRRSLIYTCLYRNNHCHTLKDSSGKLIQNELCFDNNTVASKKLAELNNLSLLDDADNKVITRWQKILQLAKATPEYKANYKYGLHQIMTELDTFDLVLKGIHFEKKYRNVDLHNNIGELNKEVKQYYEDLIEPLLFEYELIK